MIDTVAQRNALKPSPNAYFVPMGKGRHLGFRRLPGKTAIGGTWIVRVYDPASKPKRREHSLGDFATVPAKDHFHAAHKAAIDFLRHLEGGGTSDKCTVAQACAEYVRRVYRDKGKKIGLHTERRLNAIVCGNPKRNVPADPIASIDVRKLHARNLEDWRERISDRTSTRGAAPSKGTINRDMAYLKRALNIAHERGYTTSTAAWATALEAIDDAENARLLYLTRDERDSLVAHADEALRPFARALCLLPVRCGALAALNVESFNRFSSELTIGKDKGHKPRTFALPPVIAKFIAEQCKGKNVGDPLFTSASGIRWTAKNWDYPVRRAVQNAKLPHATLTNLRHATITDLVVGGLDLFSVAKIAGTSIKMIEKHYGKLQPKPVADALAKLA
jgi:site-specific recombinase XerD